MFIEAPVIADPKTELSKERGRSRAGEPANFLAGPAPAPDFFSSGSGS